jgi:hypothetical protein
MGSCACVIEREGERGREREREGESERELRSNTFPIKNKELMRETIKERGQNIFVVKITFSTSWELFGNCLFQIIWKNVTITILFN